jgi:BirA family biotin operon repressor/biotin-[acetyl-CoA-carboxylase] ligase
MPERVIHLLSSGIEGVAEEIDAETLASAHPLWAVAAETLEAQGKGAETRALQGLDSPVFICGPCTSSLDVAWRLLAEGRLPPWGSVVAVSQKSGRGRLRREWASPPGNLYAAVRLPRLEKPWLDIASLACGFFAAEALGGLGADVSVKWPNDLMLGGRKAGGILVEERGADCIMGIGVNLAGEFPEFRPRKKWSPLPASLGSVIDSGPLEVLTALVKSGQRWYDDFAALGPPERFLPALEEKMAWMNLTVMVHDDPQHEPAYAAKILGLLPDGALLVKSRGGTRSLKSGSIAPMHEEI